MRERERVRQFFGKENTSAKFSCLIASPVTAGRAVPLQGAEPGAPPHALRETDLRSGPRLLLGTRLYSTR